MAVGTISIVVFAAVKFVVSLSILKSTNAAQQNEAVDIISVYILLIVSYLHLN